MRICEIISDIKYKRTLITIAEKQGVVDYWWSSELEDGRQVFTMVVTNDSRQSVLDSLQILFEEDSRAKILVLPVDASIPRLSENTQDQKQVDQKTTREELYENVVKGVDLNLNFVLMVIFSTIVVTIGLSEDNIAVVVGAMVIAPLLGPNIALSFAASWSAIKASRLPRCCMACRRRTETTSRRRGCSSSRYSLTSRSPALVEPAANSTRRASSAAECACGDQDK